MKILKLIISNVFILSMLSAISQQTPPQAKLDSSDVRLISQTQISDSVLYFNGSQVSTGRESYQDQPGYDFAFGPHISPHGDCIDFFGKYVFLTWYRGGEEDRHVMLSRYNTETGSVATIQFEDRKSVV